MGTLGPPALGRDWGDGEGGAAEPRGGGGAAPLFGRLGSDGGLGRLEGMVRGRKRLRGMASHRAVEESMNIEHGSLRYVRAQRTHRILHGPPRRQSGFNARGAIVVTGEVGTYAFGKREVLGKVLSLFSIRQRRGEVMRIR